MITPNQDGTLRSSPLWKDVEATILKGPKLANFSTEIMIHTDKADFNVIKVLEIQEYADYVTDTSCTMFVRFLLSMGDYTYKLYPFRSKLEVSVKHPPRNEDTGFIIDQPIPTVRYRGNLDLHKNPAVAAKQTTNISYEALNTMDGLVEVRLELIDRNFEVLRVATVPGNTFEDVTPAQLAGGLMVVQSRKYLIDGKPAIDAFDMVAPDNMESMNDVIMPPGMKIGNIPTYIQERLSGMYNAGVGTFFARYNDMASWFVYPLHKTERFDEDVERAVLFVLPDNMLSGIDQTYRKVGKILYIVVTGQQQYSDDSEVSDLNEGVGFHQADANAIITKPILMEDKGPVGDRVRLNREVATRPRGDEVYYAPTVAPSSNPFKMYSQVNARQVSNVNLVWENSRPDLIYPAMPCKYVFMEQGEYTELKGTILGKYTTEALIGSPGVSSVYRRSTHLGLCLKQNKQTPDQPRSKSPGIF